MSNDDLIRSDAPLSPEQLSTLRKVLARMIPASTEYGVPGADDDVIVADILQTGRSVLPQLAATLDALAGTADEELESSLRQHHEGTAGVLMALTAQCYYRDDRVMASLDMEPRPPFPEGYEMADGDWSLLEPVRARPPFYRAVDGQ